MSELLHRPLYSVSVGELGTKVSQLEDHLSRILEVAGQWNAVILIDEADVFLEARTGQNIERNAMVGVFLRLLEYHTGVLFLTTNRVSCFDEAFRSRINVTLNFSELTDDARRQIWKNHLEFNDIKGVDVDSLIQVKLNGRQIRNVVRLSKTMEKELNQPITTDSILETIHLNYDNGLEMTNYSN